MKAALLICALGTALVLLVAAELKRHYFMVKALPPSSTVAPHEIDGMLREGYPLVAVLGTGSMQPHIPAGTGVVAWCMIERCDFRVLGKGDLVVFRTPKGNVVHQLAQLTSSGWTAAGLHNSGYDSTSVTASNFVGRVVKTYIVKK